MTDPKAMLDAATPLPWRVWDAERPGIEGPDVNGEAGTSVVVYGEGEHDYAGVDTAEDAALIVHAVNRLPDYEAAVDALAYLERIVGPEYHYYSIIGHACAEARAVLRRLRP